MKKSKLVVFVWWFLYGGLGVALLVSGVTAIEGVATQNAAAIIVGIVGLVCTSYGVAVVSSRISEMK